MSQRSHSRRSGSRRSGSAVGKTPAPTVSLCDESAPGTVEFDSGAEESLLHLQHLARGVTSGTPKAVKAAIEILRCSSLIENAAVLTAKAKGMAKGKRGAEGKAATAATVTPRSARAKTRTLLRAAARESLDCAAHIVKSLLALAGEGEATLLHGIDLTDAATVLVVSIAKRAKKLPPAELSKWERHLFGARADDEVVCATGICSQQPVAAGSTLPSRSAVEAAARKVLKASVATTQSSKPRSLKICRSPPLAPARVPEPTCFDGAAPLSEDAAEATWGLALPQHAAVAMNMSRLQSAALDLLRQRPADGQPLPEWLALEKWAGAKDLGPTVAVAAANVVAAVKVCHVPAPVATPARDVVSVDSHLFRRESLEQLDPVVAAKLKNLQRELQFSEELRKVEATIQAMRAKRRVDAAVAAKNEYCRALLSYIRRCRDAPIDSHLHAVFVMCPRNVPNTTSPKRAEPRITGRCPVRASVMSSVAALLGARCQSAAEVLNILTETLDVGCSGKCGWWELDEATAPQAASALALARDMQSQRILLGACPQCGTVGKCVNYRGVPDCGGEKVGHPQPLEKMAHIIPRAASEMPDTRFLLKRCDDIERLDCANVAAVGKYLARGHNVLVLSTCIKDLFDRGVLGFVKIGPPECEFYRVRVARGRACDPINFGGDFQLRSLLTHPEQFRGPQAAIAGVLDGLVIDLTRPGGGPVALQKPGVVVQFSESANPSVSHRYLELHAQAHGITGEPLNLQLQLLTEEALAQVDHPAVEGVPVNMSNPNDDDADPFLLQWLHDLGLPPIDLCDGSK